LSFMLFVHFYSDILLKFRQPFNFPSLFHRIKFHWTIYEAIWVVIIAFRVTIIFVDDLFEPQFSFK
jgi:hypothetical protein